MGSSQRCSTHESRSNKNTTRCSVLRVALRPSVAARVASMSVIRVVNARTSRIVWHTLLATQAARTRTGRWIDRDTIEDFCCQYLQDFQPMACSGCRAARPGVSKVRPCQHGPPGQRERTIVSHDLAVVSIHRRYAVVVRQREALELQRACMDDVAEHPRRVSIIMHSR